MKSIFEIPDEHRISQVIEQNTYLINGELKHWSGNRANVYSPIYTTNTEGKLAPTFLGKIPDLGENEALQALKDKMEGKGN